METKMIGNKITEARKKLNLSQAQLGEKLFISPQAVGKWERGESVPDLIMLNKLTKILGVDLNYFSEHSESAEIAELSSITAVKQNSKTVSKALPSWNMSMGNWTDADFSGLKNLGEKFSSSNIQRCRFVGSEMAGILFKNNNIQQCDFSNSDFTDSQFQNSNLVKNNFTHARLIRGQLSASYFNNCDFSNADLTGLASKSSGFEKCNFTGARVSGVSFVNTYFGDIVLEGSIENCSFENCGFRKITFQNAKLTNTFFKGSRLKRIKFIDCQADRLTYEFLKSGKADLSGIQLIA
ncbi:MAG: pentapeptide repeat-containing protein [Crocinitomicaceae bacterium]|nr:pentapeptide repeat-containing protein [Crocinitomicaceae bacterium]